MFQVDLEKLTPEQRAMVDLWEEHLKAEFQDAAGAVVRSVTLAAAAATCWNTALSDSVRYSASLYLPTQPSATPIGAKWVLHSALAVSHTWRVAIDPQGSALPTLDLAGVSPDRGC